MDKAQTNPPSRPTPDPRQAFAQGQLLGTQPFNAAGDVPGAEVNDPDQQAAAGVHRHRIRPQRRGGGPR